MWQMAILVHCFLFLAFNSLTEVSRVGVLGSFAIFLSILQSDLEVNLLGGLLLGKLWLFFNTHLNAQDQQAHKTSAFVQMLTFI